MNTRECPKCSTVIFYKTIVGYIEAEQKNLSCGCDKAEQKSREVLIRICPECRDVIHYGSLKSYDQALKKNATCNKCNQEQLNAPKERECPKCRVKMIYPNSKLCAAAESKKAKCKGCGARKILFGKNTLPIRSDERASVIEFLNEYGQASGKTGL